MRADSRRSTFRVDDVLRFDGETRLILRVVGPILLQDKRVDGMGPMETPQWRGAITGGIWQPVRLVATGDSLCEGRVHRTENLRQHGDLSRWSWNTRVTSTASTEIEIAIRSGDRVVAKINDTLTLKPGTNRQTRMLKIPDAKYWSPDNPHLYHAEVTCWGIRSMELPVRDA